MATSPTAGNFDCADLQIINAAIDRIWLDNQVKKDYISYSDTIKAIMAEQTASFPDLKSAEKDQEVKVYWPADCSTSLADCDDDCSVGGPTPEAQCKNYRLTIYKKAGFSAPEKAFRASNLSREEVVARGLMKRMKELDEYISQQAVSKLNSFAGTNQFAGGIGVVDGGSGDTYIKAPHWNADIMGYFAQVAKMNKLQNAFLLNGNNLYQQNWMAQFNNLNADQKDQMAKFGSLRTYWDPFNVDSVNGDEKITYLIDKGAIAFVTKAYYPSTPIEYIGAGQTRYSIPSRSLPGIVYDVVYTNRCVSNEIYHDWTLYVTFDLFQNPLGCNEDMTGILRFLCGDAPAGS